MPPNRKWESGIDRCHRLGSVNVLSMWLCYHNDSDEATVRQGIRHNILEDICHPEILIRIS